MLIIKSSKKINQFRHFSTKPPGFDLFDDFIEEKIEERKIDFGNDLKAQIEEVLDQEAPDLKQFEASKKDKAGKGAGAAGNMQKPLVVVGPVCSGKSTLIDFLKYNKPRYFQHIPNYTSRTDFLKSEIVDQDYKVAPSGDKFFTQ